MRVSPGIEKHKEWSHQAKELPAEILATFVKVERPRDA